MDQNNDMNDCLNTNDKIDEVNSNKLIRSEFKFKNIFENQSEIDKNQSIKRKHNDIQPNKESKDDKKSN